MAFQIDNDQEDSDFFEQLANDLGDEDNGSKKSSNLDDDTSFEEAFSRLNVDDQGRSNVSAPASSMIEQSGGGSDDFWLEESLLTLDTKEEVKEGSIMDGEDSVLLPVDTSLGSDNSLSVRPPSDLKSIDSAGSFTSPQMVVETDGNEDPGTSVEGLNIPTMVDINVNVALGSSMEGLTMPQMVKTDVNGELGLPTEGSITATLPQMDATNVDNNRVPPVDSAILPPGMVPTDLNGDIVVPSMEDSVIITSPDANGDLCHPCMDGPVMEILTPTVETTVNGDGRTSVDSFITKPSKVEIDAVRDQGNSSVDDANMAPDVDMSFIPDTMGIGNEEESQQFSLKEPSVDDAHTMLTPNTEVSMNSFIESEGVAREESEGSVPKDAIGIPPTVKVLDWSSFGGVVQPNSFGSYSDFFSDLGDQEDSSSGYGISTINQKDQVKSSSMESSIAQEGWGNSSQIIQPSGYDEAEYWNQPEIVNYGVGGVEEINGAHATTATVVGDQQAAGYSNTGFIGTIGNSIGNISTGIETQQDVDVQSWENMYPGWYFDYTTNEWKQNIQAGSGAVEQSYTNVAEVDQSYNTVAEVDPLYTNIPDLSSNFKIMDPSLAQDSSNIDPVATMPTSSWKHLTQAQTSHSMPGTDLSHAQEGSTINKVAILPRSSWQQTSQEQSPWSTEGIEPSLAQQGPIKPTLSGSSWQETSQGQSSWSMGGIDHSLPQEDINPTLFGSSWQQTSKVQSSWSMGGIDPSLAQERSLNSTLPGSSWQQANQEQSSWSVAGINPSLAQESSINEVATLPRSSWQQTTSQEQSSWSMAGPDLGRNTQLSNIDQYATDTQLSSIDQYAMDTQLHNNDQYATDGGLAYQQDASWENQYPGWYYDHAAQEWRQIDVNETFNQEASQVTAEPTSSQLASNTWAEGQDQSYYQGNVNQGAYWPENSQSSYSSGTNAMTMLNRDASFNSWADSKVQQVDIQHPLTGPNIESINESFQGANVRFWSGFQDNANASSYNYESVGVGFQDSANSSSYNNFASQTAYKLSDNTAFFGNQPAVVQPHSADSSAGRPLHPLAVFGFGGKLLVMKALQMGKPEPIVFHDLNQLVLSAENHSYNDGKTYFSAMNHQGLTFPLVGHGPTSKELVKWIDERTDKCETEDRHCTSSEALSVLWGVLKIACLHYGKLRSLAGSAGLKSQAEDGPEVALGKLLSAAKNQRQWNLAGNPGLDALSTLPREDQLQATAREVRVNLMDGKRKEALHLAQQGQLWGLALVLAWQLGEKAYSDTILQMAQQQFFPGSPMRTLLLLFAGQTAELFNSQNVVSSTGTPGPYLPGSSTIKDSAGGMLGDWLGNLSVIAANPTKGDEQVITHLGDSLWKDLGEVAGAHTCYLVADASFESFSREARLCLIGADHFKHQRTFATPLAIQRTEIFEYAKVLGNSQYILVPFQPYKLLYAYMLAEAGKMSEASRYCQVVIKALKNAGRAPEIEFCKQSAVALEERLRLHSQGGYNLNFSTGKLVGRVMGTIDSTIHKIIGGPNLPPVEKPTPTPANTGDWVSNGQKYGTPVKSTSEQIYGYPGTPSKATPIGPSASINNLVNTNSNQVDMVARSVSEPNLSWSPAQEVQKSAANSETSSPSPKKPPKPQGSTGGYFGRFGSQILSKAVGLIKHSKHEAKLGDENKFYYDEKLKRWVETGVDQSQEEAVLAPPPMATKFSSSAGGSPMVDAKSSGESQGVGPNGSSSLSSSADLPPMPPGINQFSARGRLQGVRSRYVDTFNKGNTPSPAKPTESPIVPMGGWGKASSPSQFFTAASVSPATESNNENLANGYSFGGTMLSNMASNNTLSDHLQGDHEPLLPKDLSSSFMAVPLAQRHSSASDLSTLSGNTMVSAANHDKKNAYANISKAASWSGEAPKVHMQRSALDTSGDIDTTTGKQVLMNGVSNFLPSPPGVQPQASFSSFGSGHVPMMNMPPPPMSLQGGIYGEMQEVEL